MSNGFDTEIPPRDREWGERTHQVIREEHHHHHDGNGNVTKLVWGCAGAFGLILIGIGIWNAAVTVELVREVSAIKATLAIMVQERGK